jgi:hypothetical protein
MTPNGMTPNGMTPNGTTPNGTTPNIMDMATSMGFNPQTIGNIQSTMMQAISSNPQLKELATSLGIDLNNPASLQKLLNNPQALAKMIESHPQAQEIAKQMGIDLNNPESLKQVFSNPSTMLNAAVNSPQAQAMIQSIQNNPQIKQLISSLGIDMNTLQQFINNPKESINNIQKNPEIQKFVNSLGIDADSLQQVINNPIESINNIQKNPKLKKFVNSLGVNDPASLQQFLSDPNAVSEAVIRTSLSNPKILFGAAKGVLSTKGGLSTAMKVFGAANDPTGKSMENLFKKEMSTPGGLKNMGSTFFNAASGALKENGGVKGFLKGGSIQKGGSGGYTLREPMTGHLINMTELICNIVETKMEKYIQSVFFDYLLRDYTPELTDQKTIRNTINALLKNKVLIDLINTEYELIDNPITVKTFSKKPKEKPPVKSETETKTKTEDDSKNQENLNKNISAVDGVDATSMMGGAPTTDAEAKPETDAEAKPEPEPDAEAKPEPVTEAKPEAKPDAEPVTEAKPETKTDAETKPETEAQPLDVRIQIMHWYMFFNYYFLKVAIEVTFIKYVNPHSFFSNFFYSAELSQHPVLEDEYLNETLAEYNEIFNKIKPILTIDVLKTDMNKKIMKHIFTTQIFDTFAKEAGHGRIAGGTHSPINKHVPKKSKQYKRIPRSVKYRRSTRHRKKHRRVTSKSRPQYTSKKRNIKRVYSKKHRT